MLYGVNTLVFALLYEHDVHLTLERADANVLALHVNIQATASFSDLLRVWYM